MTRSFYDESRSKIHRFTKQLGNDTVVYYKRHEICYCHDENGVFVEKYATREEFEKQENESVDLIAQMVAAGVPRKIPKVVKSKPQSNDKFYYCTCMPEAEQPELAFNSEKYWEDTICKVIHSRSKREQVACPDVAGERTKPLFLTPFPNLPPSEW